MTDTHAAPITVAQTALPERVHPMVALAMRQSPDVATIRELVELQKQWEEHESKRSYTAALVQLKQNMPTVVSRDKVVDYPGNDGKRTRYTHASIAHVIESVTEHLTACGFALHWEPSTNDRGMVQVTCRLTHRDGHSETCTLSAPADNGGKKSPVQAVASTVTLLERYTACSLLGIVTKDMPEPQGEVDPEDVIDADRNRSAGARLSKRGIDRAEAERFLNKPIAKWTGADLSALTERYLKPLAERQPGED